MCVHVCACACVLRARLSGTVTGYQDAEKKYKIKLDEGTKITAALPDNDIEILGVPPPLAKEMWFAKAASSRAMGRGASKSRENFVFPPTMAEDASAGLDAIKETTVIERTRRPRAQMVHYAGVKAVERQGLPGLWLWQAELALCGHVRDLGVYDTPEEAAAAYNRAVVWFRTAAAGSRSSTRGSPCEFAQVLAGLVLNAVDGVAYSKELHAPAHFDDTPTDTGADELDATVNDGTEHEQERPGDGAEEGESADKLCENGVGAMTDEGGGYEVEEGEDEDGGEDGGVAGDADTESGNESTRA